MLPPFKELLKFDVSPYVTKRPTYRHDPVTDQQIENPEEDWIEYLPWVNCLTLLYGNGAEKVKYSFGDGHPVTYSPDNDYPFVTVRLNIDGEEYKTSYPVISGYAALQKPTNLEIHWAQQRAFVKCVAIHTGLGLSLWTKEEQATAEPEKKDNLLEIVKREIKNLKTPNELKDYYYNRPALRGNNEVIEYITEQAAKLEKAA